MFWYQDQIFTDSTLPFDTRDRGLLLGDGVFDTALVLDGAVIDRDVHVDRVIRHAGVIGLYPDRMILNRAIDALIPGKDGLLRLTITRGVGQRGLAPAPDAIPSILASLSPVDKNGFFQPVRLWLTPTRRNETSPLSQIKSLNYLDAVLAQRDAMAAGADEAIFLNTQGHLCCAASGNIFVLQDDGIKTPPLADGVMDGTIRHWLLKQDFGIREQSMTEQDLHNAKGIFITNSRRLIAPASDYHGRALLITAFAPIQQALRDYLTKKL